MLKLPLIIIIFLLSLTTPTSASTQPEVLFFYAEHCQECHEIKESFLPAVVQKYNNSLQIQYYELSSIDNFQRLLELESKLGQKINKTPPLIIVGNEVLEGKTEIKAKLEQLLNQRLKEHETKN